MKTTKVTVVIPIWNSQTWLVGCLEGLRQQSYQNFRMLLIDNGSTDNSAEFIERYYPQVTLIRLPTNLGFAAAVNIGIQHSQTDYIALLNIDTLPHHGWLAALVNRIENSPSNVGAISSKMLLMTDPTRIDDAGDRLSWYGSATKRGHGHVAIDYTNTAEIFSPCAGAALYRQAFFEHVGLFDERFGSYLEDVDLGLRGRLYGYRYLYEPSAQILHHGHSAGVVGGRYIRLMTRNRLLTMLKNIPTQLLFRHGWHLLYGQLYFFLVYKRPLDSLYGYGLFLAQLPHLWQTRRTILTERSIPLEQLDRLLSTKLGEPSLREIVRQKIAPR
ncbi:glycosyltransferase family 2 protein [Anaerolineales bacterium HSG6]|nr:glycosyltransferase family 2 protein [Anaerolineales bacterium HSG6]MDM8529860.1 glycosyltransferase family 2 protein [Anaerolineales bacterium HSG25]